MGFFSFLKPVVKTVGGIVGGILGGGRSQQQASNAVNYQSIINQQNQNFQRQLQEQRRQFNLQIQANAQKGGMEKYLPYALGGVALIAAIFIFKK